MLDHRNTTDHSSPSTPALLTVRETAERLSISLSSTYDLIRSGRLPHYRIGGAIRLTAADLDRFLAGCRCEQPALTVKPPRPRLKHIKL